jgi:ABC-type bacteriocin/lantibiotic exporter with double-glycine peptidase domain
MLELVDRIIVIADHKVVLDGPKEQVIKQLQGQSASVLEKAT